MKPLPPEVATALSRIPRREREVLSLYITELRRPHGGGRAVVGSTVQEYVPPPIGAAFRVVRGGRTATLKRGTGGPVKGGRRSRKVPKKGI